MDNNSCRLQIKIVYHRDFCCSHRSSIHRQHAYPESREPQLDNTPQDGKIKRDDCDAHIYVEENSLQEGEISADWEYACWNGALDCERLRKW